MYAGYAATPWTARWSCACSVARATAGSETKRAVSSEANAQKTSRRRHIRTSCGWRLRRLRLATLSYLRVDRPSAHCRRHGCARLPLYNRGVVWCWLVLIMCLVGSLAAPLVVESQSVGTKGVRIGYLALHRPPSASDPVWQAFAQRLRELGWANGSDAVIERRYADGPGERLDALAAELVAGSVDVIVASGTSAVLAAKRATTTVPIVIAGASDPVGFGIVASLAQPGGNVTGVSDSPGREIEGKRLELLKEAIPEATRVGVVLDSSGRRDPGSIVAAAKA